MSRTCYIYGPAPSRRLGFSLGIDIIPYKTCNFDCIYCQLGHTTSRIMKRKEYVPARLVLEQVKSFFKKKQQIDFITFSGSGEPTLNSQLGYIIKGIKKITKIRVAVLTNGSLLYRSDVQKDLRQADIVLPTLCAGTQSVFEKVNRGKKVLSIEKIIAGQASFRKVFKGKIWLEVMLIKGTNDSASEILALKKAINRIDPDKIQLNTVVRPPSKKSASPLSFRELEKIRRIFGHKCEVIAHFSRKKNTVTTGEKEAAICDLIARRPVTRKDISGVLGLDAAETRKYIRNLRKQKKIKLRRHGGKQFYESS